LIKIATTAQIRQIEAEADASGLSYAELMKRAGQTIADRALAFIQTLPPDEPPRVTVLVGKGNNGGDGLVAGRLIAEQSNALVRFYLMERRNPDDLVFKAVSDAGLFVAYAHDDQRYRVLTQTIASADLIIDALYGLGARLPLPADATALLETVTAALQLSQIPPLDLLYTSEYDLPVLPHRRIIAVDCPSGVDCDTGAIDDHTLIADETVTFIAVKPGLLMAPALRAVGALTVAPLRVPDSLYAFKALNTRLVTADSARELLPVRPFDGNKGTYGSILIVGGSENYIGAPGLAARAAYRCGAGLVTVASIEKVIAALAPTNLEVTWLHCPAEAGKLASDALPLLRAPLDSVNVLVIGCGLGQSDDLRALVVALLDIGRSRDLPTVIDADALNMLAQTERFWEHLPPRAVLTPHPGEMARLTGMSVAAIQADRLNIARKYAADWGTTVLLKGAHTVIADSDRVSVLPFKTSALAKAGTGDVLAGAIGAFAHTVFTIHDAAVIAGFLHGAAGHSASRRWGGTRSALASDVIENFGTVMRQLEHSV